MSVASCQHKLWCSTEDPTEKSKSAAGLAAIFFGSDTCEDGEEPHAFWVVYAICHHGGYHVPMGTHIHPGRQTLTTEASQEDSLEKPSCRHTIFLDGETPGPQAEKSQEKPGFSRRGIIIGYQDGSCIIFCFYCMQLICRNMVAVVYGEVTLLLDTWFVWRLEHWSMRDNRIIPD